MIDIFFVTIVCLIWSYWRSNTWRPKNYPPGEEIPNEIPTRTDNNYLYLKCCRTELVTYFGQSDGIKA